MASEIEKLTEKAGNELSKLIDKTVKELLNKYAFKDIEHARKNGYEIIIQNHPISYVQLKILICKVVEVQPVPKIIFKIIWIIVNNYR